MQINKYPDGTSYVNKTQLGKQVFKLNTYEDLWHLNQFVDAFHSEYDTETVKIRPSIIIPNLIDAQADRRFNRGESTGLRLVLQFLNRLDANFEIFHPHNPEIVEAVCSNIKIIDNTDFILNVLEDLTGFEGYNNSNITLMSSDAGGFKPLMKLADKISWSGETFSASKSRKFGGGNSSITQIVDKQDFEGKDILIIDDICVYGGTFKGLAKLLRERNCGKLYLAVSHMTVQNLGKDPVTNYFDTVFSTNSKFDTYFSPGPDPLNKQSVELNYSPQNLQIIKLF